MQRQSLPIGFVVGRDGGPPIKPVRNSARKVRGARVGHATSSEVRTPVAQDHPHRGNARARRHVAGRTGKRSDGNPHLRLGIGQ
jgi:L-aminopeptidase/D-esterase-like protein